MLNLSRPERFFILALLAIGVFWTGAAYHYKVTDTGLEAIGIMEIRALIDINTATEAELERLPGIGPVLAHDIVLYRDSAGRFKSIEEIKRVKGIGTKKFENLKDFVKIDECNR